MVVQLFKLSTKDISLLCYVSFECSVKKKKKQKKKTHVIYVNQIYTYIQNKGLMIDLINFTTSINKITKCHVLL